MTVAELSGRVFPGKVTRYSHALDEATKTMLAEIEIQNPEGELFPGMYASVKIAVQRKSDALLLPAEALVLEKTKPRSSSSLITKPKRSRSRSASTMAPCRRSACIR